MSFKIKRKSKSKTGMKSYALKIGDDVNIIRAKNKKDFNKKLKDGVILWNYSWRYD